VLAPFLAVQRGNIDNNHGAILYKNSTFYNSHWRCHKQQEIDAPFRAKVFLLLAVFGGSIHDRMRKH